MKRLLALLVACLVLVGQSRGLAFADVPTLCEQRPSDPSCPVTLRAIHGLFDETVVVEPAIVEGRLYVKLRDLARVLEAYVDWNERTRTVSVEKETTDGRHFRVTLRPGVDTMIHVEANHGRDDLYDQHSFVRDGRTYIPFRFLAEALDTYVEWNGATRTVIVDHARRAEPTEADVRAHSNLVDLIQLGSTSDDHIDKFYFVPLDDGFPASPAVVAYYRNIPERINDFLTEARRNSPDFDIYVDEANMRVRVSVKYTGQPVMDIYGSHTIVWMNRTHASEFKNSIADNGARGGLATATVSTLIGIWFPPMLAIRIVLSGFAVASYWYGSKAIDASKIDRCMDRADAYLADNPTAMYRIGIVHTPFSASCIDHYLDEPLPLDHPLITQSDVADD